MKKFFLISLTLALAAASLITFAKDAAEPLDQIVAVVNDDVVTRSEFNRSLSLAKMQFAAEQKPAPAELQKKVLDDLINKKLQLQIAKQVGIKFTDEDIDRVASTIAGKNNISVDDLYQRISQEGMSKTEYRNQIRDQMTVQKLQQQEVATHLVVTPDEINTFMRGKVFQTNTSNREYHLEDMLIPVSDSASPAELEQAEKHAQSLLTSLKNGQPVAELKPDDLGWRNLAQMPTIFKEPVSKMQTHEFAGPIRAPNGFHILRLVADRSTGNSDAPNRTQAEQILMQQKFQEGVQHWVSKMRSQAFVTKTMTS